MGGRLIALREYEPGDRPYVLATWARSSSSGTRKNMQAWMARYADYMRTLESAGHVRVLVAVDESAHRQGAAVIVGWLAYSGANFVHYVYVREAYRQQGIATQLARAAGLRLQGNIGHTFEGPSMRWLRGKFKLTKIRG